MARQEQPTKASDGNQWYGPKSQFWPHRVIWAIISAFFTSIWNTIAGILYIFIHPVKSFRGLKFVVKHPRSTVRGIMQRSRASLRRNGMFYTGMSLMCMFILPGGGLFGQAAEISEHGRKADTMRREETLQHA